MWYGNIAYPYTYFLINESDYIFSILAKLDASKLEQKEFVPKTECDWVIWAALWKQTGHPSQALHGAKNKATLQKDK